MIALLPDGYYQPKEWFNAFERVDSSPAKSEFDGKNARSPFGGVEPDRLAGRRRHDL